MASPEGIAVSPGWVAATVAVAGALWGIGKVVFGVVSRQEMKDVVDGLREEMEKKHAELLKAFEDKHRENLKQSRQADRKLQHLEYDLGRVQERLRIPRRRRTDQLIGYEAGDGDDDEIGDGDSGN